MRTILFPQKQSKEEVGAGQGCGHVVHSEVGAVAEESLEAGWPWLSGDRVTEDSGPEVVVVSEGLP